MTEKPCSKCKRVLPADRFNKANWLASGLRPDCKDCYSAFKKEWWARQPKSEAAIRQAENARLAKRGQRLCKDCRKVKPRTDKHFAVTESGIWQTTCRACDRQRLRQWVEGNDDRYRANAAANWAQRNAAKKSRTIPLSPEHRREMKGIYAECRKRNRTRPRAWHVDHIVPLQGKTVSGLHVPWNLRIVPATVNVRKAAKWTSEESCLSGAATAG